MSHGTTVNHIAKNLAFYVSGTMLYGFVRSMTYDFKAKKRYFNERTRSFETKNMLLTDAVGRITFNTIAAVSVWPFMLSDDLVRLECAVYGKDPQEYGIARE